MLEKRKYVLKTLETVDGNFCDQHPNEHIQQAGCPASGAIVICALLIPVIVQICMPTVMKWALLWKNTKLLGGLEAFFRDKEQIFERVQSKMPSGNFHIHTTIKFGQRCIPQGFASARKGVQIRWAQKLIGVFISRQIRRDRCAYDKVLTNDAIMP